MLVPAKYGSDMFNNLGTMYGTIPNKLANMTKDVISGNRGADCDFEAILMKGATWDLVTHNMPI